MQTTSPGTTLPAIENIDGHACSEKGRGKKVVVLFFPNPTPGDASQYRVPYALLYLERMLHDLDLEVVLIDEQVQPDYTSILAAKCDRLLLAGVEFANRRADHGWNRLLKESARTLRRTCGMGRLACDVAARTDAARALY